VVIIISDIKLAALRESIRDQLSKNRYEHTLSVEKTVAYMGDIFLPLKKNELCAAALLHDITKEYSFEKQLKICNEFGIILRDDEKNVPEVLHGITAAAIIPLIYPSYVSDDIISSVRWHTTGYADMTMFDKIVCLADYIEDGRTHTECVEVRNYFKINVVQASDFKEKLYVLDFSLLSSLNNTIKHLENIKANINQDTLKARDWLTNQQLT